MYVMESGSAVFASMSIIHRHLGDDERSHMQ